METEAEKKESFAKLNFLRKIEKEVQEEWEKNKVFEVDPPKDTKNKMKFMGTFPYPYMNGRPHLGHTFTLTKVEFATQYERMKGKNVLFPFGFHCTGMPIKAAADKLKHLFDEFGNPPKFPEVKEVEEESKEEHSSSSNPGQAFHANKAKAKSKSSGGTQWHVLKSMDIPEEEIPKFVDALYWLGYFPKHTMADLKLLGLGVDWRRSFITTDANPYYDSFVRWQFLRLGDRGKLNYGKRYTIYSAKDGQPCADHDRQTGEGVMPFDYTLIKLELLKPFPEKLKGLENKKVYLVPGTLRPETMYGQTNCWILPDGDYGAFEINDKEAWICTERAAKNLSFQSYSKVPEKVTCLAKFKGQDLIGFPVKAPLSKYPVVYILPMLSILPNKGTGVVTSVPSDSPDDYMNFEELKKKPAFRAKFGLQDHMVLPYEVIPLIEIPGVGSAIAQKACEDLKIKSPNDRELLEEAKKQAYEKGFYQGKMMVGEFKGMSVAEAKPLIRKKLIDLGLAAPYSEPEREVISRSGDSCVVALTDQWFLDYGELSWRTQVEQHIKSMEFYSSDARNKFEFALGWLNQWACSRTYGLGTRLPQDEKFLIESLSDSTIYMAYYTVAHYLHSSIDGKQVGIANIPPEKMKPEIWDYIFLNGSYPKTTDIPESTLKKMREEFNYWYPMDLRVSGKDLINNHLIFCLYNHLAIWDSSKAPVSMRANGHIFLNGEKMSKSTGNFLTLMDGVERYSADGMRIALADAGDSLDDANFDEKTADKIVVRLWALIKWIEQVLKDKFSRSGPAVSFSDRVFETQINAAIEQTDAHYKATNYREALKSGFFDFQSAKDQYQDTLGYENMNIDLLRRFIEVQALLLTPIAPHFAEHVWKLLSKKGSIRVALWPSHSPSDPVLLKQNKYFRDLMHTIRLRKDLAKNAKTLKIQVSEGFPEWQEKITSVIREQYQTTKALPNKNDLAKTLLGLPELKKYAKKVMSFANRVYEEFESRGPSALDARVVAFSEKDLLTELIPQINKLTALSTSVALVEEKDQEKCEPLKPFFTFV